MFVPGMTKIVFDLREKVLHQGYLNLLVPPAKRSTFERSADESKLGASLLLHNYLQTASRFHSAPF